MNAVKDRLKEYLAYKNLSQGRFADICGLSKGFVNNIVNSIQPKTLDKIAIHFKDLNIAWLLTGEGSMVNCFNPESDGDMDTGVNQRIKRIIEDSGKTITSYSCLIGVSQPTLKACVDGSNKPSYDTIQKILVVNPTISAEWLLRGKGDMYISTTSNGPAKTGDSITTERLLAIIESQQRTIENLLSR